MNTTRHNSVPGPQSSVLVDDYKERAREQWSANPCGAHVARDWEFGTREYFDAIEHNRYVEYAPWMKEVIGFDRYAGKRLIEVGVGTGTDLLQFARGGSLVTGIDLTPRSIEIARRRFEVYGFTGEFAIGDGESLSFPDASFDVAYSFGVLHHTPDTQGAVREIHRVLKPGGKAIVMLYHRRSLYYWGSLVLKHGILSRELFNASMAEIMSRHVEYSQANGRPLVKAYTRAEACRLFRGFSKCKFEVNQLTRHDLRPIGRLIPEALFKWLARCFGWNLLITATK
ncbi:MAG: class I SAM-dependent methyltransferase [Acidobacteriota bacterium]